MSSINTANSPSRIQTWIGYVFSALPMLFMLMSAAMKLSHAPMAVEGFAKSGMSVNVLTAIGIVELLCVILYLLPMTAVLGAVLTTGYLGGAIMVHVRAGELAFISPLVLGMMAWGGLFMRDLRIRELLPLYKRRS